MLKFALTLLAGGVATSFAEYHAGITFYGGVAKMIKDLISLFHKPSSGVTITPIK